MPRAQASHLFLSLLTIIIFALIILFGYKFVATFKAKSDSLLLLKFERDVQATLHSVTYGTAKIRTFEVPAGYGEFWLIDRTQPCQRSALPSAAVCDDIPAEVADAREDVKLTKNSFLIGPEKIHAFTLDRMSVASGCTCTPITDGQLELSLSKG